MALSMLGYRCCSDIDDLPKDEHVSLFKVKNDRVFDAYINIGSLENRYIELAKLYPDAKFVVTVGADEDIDILKKRTTEDGAAFGSWIDEVNRSKREELICQIQRLRSDLLILTNQARNKWRLLCDFLECIPSASQYPVSVDQMQRRLSIHNVKSNRGNLPRSRSLKFDTSPWIATSRKRWRGVPSDGGDVDLLAEESTTKTCERFRTLDKSFWLLREDTFPGNLALFDPSNFSINEDALARLTVRKQRSGVRDYTSASICCRPSFLYGRFEVVIRPTNVSGLVTGVFLHRNSPRQEIDIELFGKDTTKLLVNVYYNPGSDGTRFDYGYRGTPVLIDLGFDGSRDFHRYRIDWSPSVIQWFVDGRLVHERFNWEPTPVPHLPMQFHVNLWPSRSVKLAGRLSVRDLPACSGIRSITLQGRSC